LNPGYIQTTSINQFVGYIQSTSICVIEH